jgi:hypothetical protein
MLPRRPSLNLSLPPKSQKLSLQWTPVQVLAQTDLALHSIESFGLPCAWKCNNFFDEFYAGTLDLDGLNRALLVLLPKKEGVRTADGFRPISLQNFPMKLFAKVLVNRLKPSIPLIVDADQTGFVHGRSIAENFVYAADLLSCFYKHKAPTAVLKLDFKKAFDSVEWSSLDAILRA